MHSTPILTEGHCCAALGLFSLRPGLRSRVGNKLGLYFRWHPGGSPFTLKMLFNFLILSVAASFESQIKISKPAYLIGSKAIFPLPIGQTLLKAMCVPLFQGIQGHVYRIPSPTLTSSSSFCQKHFSLYSCSPERGAIPLISQGPHLQWSRSPPLPSKFPS